jgi:hypothetical protein
VNVRWFGPIAREKEEPVRTASENRRAHDVDSVSFDRKASRSFEPALTCRSARVSRSPTRGSTRRRDRGRSRRTTAVPVPGTTKTDTSTRIRA